MSHSAIAKSTGLLRKVENKQIPNLRSRVQPAAARSAEMALWVPHPRTGIYYPKGFAWVMEDVPTGAASFSQSYWLRSSDAETVSTPTLNDAAAFDHPFV